MSISSTLSSESSGLSEARQRVTKSAKAFAEFLVLLVRFLDVVAQGLGEIGNAAFELIHGAVEFALVGFVVGEEAVEEIGDFHGFAEGEFAGFGAVLKENGDLRVLKDGVAGGVTGLEFLLDFGGEVVGSVLGFPPAAGETEFVADGAVGNDAFAAGVGGELGNQLFALIRVHSRPICFKPGAGSPSASCGCAAY